MAGPLRVPKHSHLPFPAGTALCGTKRICIAGWFHRPHSKDIQHIRMDMDYKQQDALRILDYLRRYPDGVSVDDILQHSGADRLRVYPALFELEQEGRVEVLEREEKLNQYIASRPQNVPLSGGDILKELHSVRYHQ